jgi:hypothetical protein
MGFLHPYIDGATHPSVQQKPRPHVAPASVRNRLSASITVLSALPCRLSIVRDKRQGWHYACTTFQLHVPILARLVTVNAPPIAEFELIEDS